MSVNAKHSSRWFKRFGRDNVGRQRLMCFHHAGGGPSAFREWQRHCPPDTEVWAVALPGREARITESPLHKLQDLAAAVVEVLPLDKPFAFFGHSMGGLIAFEVARQLHERQLVVPQHMFVSACPAPHLCHRIRSRADLSDAELLQLMNGFGGTPKEIMGSVEYLEMVMSTLRADFNLIDSYLLPEACCSRFRITTYVGTSDENVRLESVAAWDRWATREFSCHGFEGGHFYLNEQREALIRDLLSRWQ